MLSKQAGRDGKLNWTEYTTLAQERPDLHWLRSSSDAHKESRTF